jgi:hypothetical protein
MNVRSDVEAAIVTLMLVGAVSLVAAIVGGNVKLPGDVQFDALKNPALRIILAVVGMGLIGLGFSLFGAGTSQTSNSAGGGGTAPPQATSTEGEHRQYLQALLPICQHWQQQLTTLGNLNQSDLSDYPRFYGGVASMVSQWSSDMKVIDPPPGEAEQLDHIFNELDLTAKKYADLASAAAAGDRDVAIQEATRAEDALGKYNADAQAFGFNAQCLL